MFAVMLYIILHESLLLFNDKKNKNLSQVTDSYKDFQCVSVKVSGNLLVTLQPFLVFISFVISMCHNF